MGEARCLCSENSAADSMILTANLICPLLFPYLFQNRHSLGVRQTGISGQTAKGHPTDRTLKKSLPLSFRSVIVVPRAAPRTWGEAAPAQSHNPSRYYLYFAVTPLLWLVTIHQRRNHSDREVTSTGHCDVPTLPPRATFWFRSVPALNTGVFSPVKFYFLNSFFTTFLKWKTAKHSSFSVQILTKLAP